MAEGEEEEVTLIKKVTKAFDYIEDIENFGKVMDKVQRAKLSKEEFDGIYIASTDMLEILNKIKNNEVLPREIEANLREMKRQARDEKTLYTDLNGNEIEVNDGNTWVHICPKNAEVEITGNENQEETNTINNTSNNM